MRAMLRSFCAMIRRCASIFARTSPASIGSIALLKKTVKVKKVVDGEEKEVEETTEEKIPGYLEAVYHLYSMTHKHGPVIIRMRTADRAENACLPSLTPIWRSAEFQEREIFDLYGVRFDGHPDLRRILMWDEFEDHPMRKDYANRTITNTNRRRTTKCWRKRKQHYAPRDRRAMARKASLNGSKQA